MILHKDGTLEGTPEELHQWSKLQEKKELFKVIPPFTTTGVDQGTYPTVIKQSGSSDPRYPGSGVFYVTTVQPKVNMSDYNSPMDYVQGLLKAIRNGTDLH